MQHNLNAEWHIHEWKQRLHFNLRLIIANLLPRTILFLRDYVNGFFMVHRRDGFLYLVYAPSKKS
jgi:hypothetical protein